MLHSGFIQKAVTILKQWLTHTISNSKRQAFKGEFPSVFAAKASLREGRLKLRLPLEVVFLGSKQFITGVSYVVICAMLTLVLSILVFILCISPHQLTIAFLSWLVYVTQKVHIRVKFYIIG